jgi:5-methylcytosine-specific restriction enzyme subunit McrC
MTTRVSVVEGASLRLRYAGERREAGQLDARHFERLQRWDEQTSRGRAGHQVFRWSLKTARPNGFVGVVQLGDLVIEVLPKVCSVDEAQSRFARGNLLCMLSYALKLRSLHRGSAPQELLPGQIAEVMLRQLAQTLRDALFDGQERRYREVQERRGALKGRLMLREQLCRGLGRADHLYVAYEDYMADTALNQALKAACLALMKVSRSLKTRALFTACLAMFDQVSSLPIEQIDWSHIELNRISARFEPALTLARQLVSGLRSTGRVGADQTFSLLYPMPALYEQFMREFLIQEVLRERDGYQLVAQSSAPPRYLLRADQEQTARLKPDLLLHTPSGPLVLDAKWKHLSQDEARQGVSTADIYQLLIYGHAFASRRVVLLYPAPLDAQIMPQRYESCVSAGDTFVSLERAFIPLGADLNEPRARRELAAHLWRIIAPRR